MRTGSVLNPCTCRLLECPAVGRLSLRYSEVQVIRDEICAVKRVTPLEVRMLAVQDRLLASYPGQLGRIEPVISSAERFVMKQMDARANHLVPAVLDEAEAQCNVVVRHRQVFVEPAHSIKLLSLDHEASPSHGDPVVLDQITAKITRIACTDVLECMIGAMEEIDHACVLHRQRA